MGASAVLIGRPILYALAAGGVDKTVEIIEDIKKELGKDLLLCGLSSIGDITPDILRHQ